MPASLNSPITTTKPLGCLCLIVIALTHPIFNIIISISLVLFLLGLVGLLLLNTKRLSVHIKENIGFSVILIDDAKEVDIIRLQKNLDAHNRYPPQGMPNLKNFFSS